MREHPEEVQYLEVAALGLLEGKIFAELVLQPLPETLYVFIADVYSLDGSVLRYRMHDVEECVWRTFLKIYDGILADNESQQRLT